MLTDLQKRKLTSWFNLCDLDKNGALEARDYERLIDNVARERGFAAGSAGYDQIRAGYMRGWQQVERFADAATPGKVGLAQFLDSHDEMLSDRKLFDALILGVAESIIKLSDQDGDGRLSEREYTSNMGAYGLDAAHARAAFARLDRDADGYIGKDELLKDVEEFYYSDDPAAPGNWLVGPY
jgi:Ca2+-binding EF-hand superfamily protein